MKKYKGEFLRSTVVVLSLSLLLSACSMKLNNAGSSSSPGNSTQSDISTIAVPTKEVAIVVWDKPAADDKLRVFKEKEFAEFDVLYPNIKVTHEELAPGGKDREQYLTAMAGGKGPDATPNNPYPDIERYINQGFDLDITDRWNHWTEKNNFLPSAVEAATKDGKVYGIPKDTYIIGMVYNKKNFRDAGLDPNKPPATWNEFVDAAQKLTDPNKNKIGYDILGMDWADWFFEYYVWQAGGDLTKKNDDGSATLTFTSEPAITALQFWKDLKWKYKVTQKNVTQSGDDNLKDFNSGRTSIIVGEPDWYTSGDIPLKDIGFAPLPAGPSGKSPAQVGGSSWTINAKSSKNKQDAAWLYITFMTSKKFYEDQLKFEKDHGVFPSLLSVRMDVDVSKSFNNIPPDIMAGVNKAAKDTHLEYFLKDRLSKYVVSAIQKVLLDPNADPLTELQKQQALAQKEVVDKYNADLKK